MRVVSWNVNGLRSALCKGFGKWLSAGGADVVGLQEVRATEAQLEPSRACWSAWQCHFAAAERLGYSGVALFAKRCPDEVVTSLGRPDFDREGRFVLARFGRLTIVNAYFPNGSGKDRDNSRIPYKLAFYRHLFELLEPARRAGDPVLVMGDFNVAHRPIDLARPKQNEATSGFTPIEREEFERLLRAGWVDTFRHYEPGPGHYTWWSQRAGVRERNIGWRIDYVLASQGAMPFMRSAFHRPDVRGSDHCPIGIEIDDAVLGAPRAAKASPLGKKAVAAPSHRRASRPAVIS